LHGQSEVGRAQVVIDTGAIYTVVHPRFLERIGATPTGDVSVRTLERTLRIPVFTVERVSVFGMTLNQYPVLAYAPAAFTPGIDGILSIDILQSLGARLDFASGVLTIP
jgi:predicted aspartyl protease